MIRPAILSLVLFFVGCDCCPDAHGKPIYVKPPETFQATPRRAIVDAPTFPEQPGAAGYWGCTPNGCGWQAYPHPYTPRWSRWRRY